ncbi:DUF6188 family protein [Enteractinococcus coprophilus]|uniref:Uncharacterized protein n=1 Tax=Enteractinococcus coprophilus TaxID=1027633 RepID=A0A543ANZ2_9MICC|nr:DUF6188 family protein [Enteractinococcus coprophilus]TQL74294.1 hypothetical protein FB556_0754 [Enteractinococcus coprophilus]
MTRNTAADPHLQLVGTHVAFIGVDFQITLRFSNNCVVRLESVFSISIITGIQTIIDPDGDKARFVPVLQLHGETVEAAHVDDSVLVLKFSNGSVLEAGPNQDYESWSYTGPESTPTRVIAMPGGELAVWLSDDDV